MFLSETLGRTCIKATAVVAAAFVFSLAGIEARNTKPAVIPELKEWKGQEGYFTISGTSRIVCPEKDEEMLRIAEMFAEDYSVMSGRQIEVVSGKACPGDLSFSLKKDGKLGTEGYEIQISDRIKVTAPAYAGLYWATRTLLQMSERSEGLPKGTIRDWPDYGIRGFMMDCGRKFIPMSYLRDLVKMMSYYKMNTLQIHLNDNGFKQFFGQDWDRTYSAFRLECDTYPGLAARDGFYTKDDFRDFQKKAFSQFVEIIPEIDAPAHTLAFCQYKPEIGSKDYGMDHLDLFNPETYTFMDGLFKEYLEGDDPVFAGPKVHIGTDEYSNKDQEVVEKFREFTDRYIRLVESYGKQACVWGALTHADGKTPVKSENVIMSAWYNGYADPKTMVEQGYKLISIPDDFVYIVPAAGYYHDYLDDRYLYENWTPAHVGNTVFEEKDPAILGGMFAVWNDHVGNGITVKDIHHRLFPSLQTLSVKMWTGTSVSLPFPDFDAVRRTLSEAPGVNQAGKIGDGPACIFSTDVLESGAELPYEEIGYDYTISFDICAAYETPGTCLFSSESAVFYLSDPVGGLFGFARDGYLDTFCFRPYEGEKLHIDIAGDNTSTILAVNGRVMHISKNGKQWFDEGKDSTAYVGALVFPLRKAGTFRSRITDFKVYNYRKQL